MGGALALLFAGAGMASAAESSDIKRLAEIQQVEDVQAFEVEMKEMAEAAGIPFDDFTSVALAEVEHELADAQAEVSEATGMTTMGPGACTSRKMPSASQRGDHIWIPSLPIFGHSALYWSGTSIIEAPGVNKKSRQIHISDRSACKGAQVQHVKTSAGNRVSAVNRAKNSYVGKSYDKSFAVNKTNGPSKLNCSELVWRAYRHSASGLNLDSNGGKGVFPNNIKNHGKTSTYKTLT